jgi:hypothetical protein
MKLGKGNTISNSLLSFLLAGALRFLNWKLPMFEADVYLSGWSGMVDYTSTRHIWCAYNLCLLL